MRAVAVERLGRTKEIPNENTSFILRSDSYSSSFVGNSLPVRPTAMCSALRTVIQQVEKVRYKNILYLHPNKAEYNRR